MSDLFRKEVLQHQHTDWAGRVILVRPVSFAFLTGCALVVGLVIVAFLIWGEYTKRSTVQGQLLPSSGLVQVYSSSVGTISEKHVFEGQQVKKGDVLYKISIARHSDAGNVQQAIAEQLALKKTLIDHEMTRTKSAQAQERQRVLSDIERLRVDLGRLDAQIALQRSQVEIAKTNLERYQLAKESEAVSEEALSVKQMEYTAQMEALAALTRESAAIDRQIQVQQITLRRMDEEHVATLLRFEQSLSDNAQANIQNSASDVLVVQAQVDGVIGSVGADIGQFVDGTKPLASLLPKDDELIAQLYVPSRAIGFIKIGDTVRLRYGAYPYQKFGSAKAQVISVAKTAVAAQNLSAVGTVTVAQSTGNEPIYVVRARLDKQTVKAYGQELPLQTGMTLEGDVLHETRKLYEWVLEPLYSISGRLMN